MDDTAYELIAMGARYWFILLGALILWRSYRWLYRDAEERRRVLRALPDAGMVGEIVDLEDNRAYPLPREGVLGSGRGCDIRLRGLRRRHADFSFVEGKGLLIRPCHTRSDILLEEEPIGRGGYALHGMQMATGGYCLRIRLFAGLDAPRPAPYMPDRPVWRAAYGDELYAPESYGGFVQPEYDPVPYSMDPQENADDMYGVLPGSSEDGGYPDSYDDADVRQPYGQSGPSFPEEPQEVDPLADQETRRGHRRRRG